jgi:hypothetical protein
MSLSCSGLYLSAPAPEAGVLLAPSDWRATPLPLTLLLVLVLLVVVLAVKLSSSCAHNVAQV